MWCPSSPISAHYHVKMTTTGGKTIQWTIKRQKYALTPAYTFTDYCSQGVTIPHILLNITPPPTGTLNLFNLYVALS
jgi:hypothetical protein